jgi:hypothetical protein
MGRRGVSRVGYIEGRVGYVASRGIEDIDDRGTSSTSRGKTSSPLMCTAVVVSLQTSRGIEVTSSSRGHRGGVED